MIAVDAAGRTALVRLDRPGGATERRTAGGVCLTRCPPLIVEVAVGLRGDDTEFDPARPTPSRAHGLDTTTVSSPVSPVEWLDDVFTRRLAQHVGTLAE